MAAIQPERGGKNLDDDLPHSAHQLPSFPALSPSKPSHTAGQCCLGPLLCQSSPLCHVKQIAVSSSSSQSSSACTPPFCPLTALNSANLLADCLLRYRKTNHLPGCLLTCRPTTHSATVLCHPVFKVPPPLSTIRQWSTLLARCRPICRTTRSSIPQTLEPSRTNERPRSWRTHSQRRSRQLRPIYSYVLRDLFMPFSNN